MPKLYGVGCAGRITQFAETGDGRYLITLVGIARFRVADELPTTTPYRQCRVSYEPFTADFLPRAGEDEVDRAGVLRALRDFVEANDLKVDWRGIEQAPNEALVNALCMMSPFGAAREAGAARGAGPEDARGGADRHHRDRARPRRGFRADPAMRGHAMADETTPVEATRIDPKLLEILVCPLTKGPLEYDAARQELISRQAKLVYPIRDGIPIMLPEEARPLTE